MPMEAEEEVEMGIELMENGQLQLHPQPAMTAHTDRKRRTSLIMGDLGTVAGSSSQMDAAIAAATGTTGAAGKAPKGMILPQDLEEDEQVCPIMTLPDELLIHIFEYVSADAGQRLYSTACDGLKCVSSFAQTCKRMRRIAYNETPSWSRLFISRFGSAPRHMYTSRTDISFQALFHKLGEFAGNALTFGGGNGGGSVREREREPDLESGLGPLGPLVDGQVDRSSAQGVDDDRAVSRSTVLFHTLRRLQGLQPNPVPGGIRRVAHSIRVPKPDGNWRMAYNLRHMDSVRRHRRHIHETELIENEARKRNRPHRRFGRWVRDDVLDDEPQDRSLQCGGLFVAVVPLVFFILLGLKLDGVLGVASFSAAVFLPWWIGGGLLVVLGCCAGADEDDFRYCHCHPFGVSLGGAAGLCISACILLFPIFVALRADGVVDWSWAIVMIPVFIVMVVPLVLPFVVLFNMYDEDDGFEELVSIEGFVALIAMLCLWSLVVFSIILPIWLDGVWAISLYELCIPLWVIGGLALFVAVALQWIGLLLYSAVIAPLFVVFPLLLALKVEGAIVTSWVIVFSPLYVFVGLTTLAVCAAIIFKDNLGTLWTS